VQISRNHLHFARNSPLCGIVHKGSAFCTQSASIYEGIGERGELVGGVTTPESWPMGTPGLAMALYWPTGWPHWPTGKLVDGGEQLHSILQYGLRGWANNSPAR
jgi:hypothetical protein